MLILYFITILDKLQFLACIVIIFLVIAQMILIIIFYVEGNNKFNFKIIKYLSLAVIVFVLIPTQKEMALIYVLPKIINSDVVKNDLPEIYNLAIEELKRNLTEQTGEKK